MIDASVKRVDALLKYFMSIFCIINIKDLMLEAAYYIPRKGCEADKKVQYIYWKYQVNWEGIKFGNIFVNAIVQYK